MEDEIGIIKYLFNKGHLKLEFHTPQSVKNYYQCLTNRVSAIGITSPSLDPSLNTETSNFILYTIKKTLM